MDIFFDGVHLPFKDISFDNIIALEVLEHVEELDDLMFEINRALKKDGFFVASIPFGWPEHEKPFDFRRFTTFGIEKLLIKNKFEIVLISKSGTLISSLLQIIIYYIDDIFSKTDKLRYFLWPIYSIPINSLSLILDFLLPKNKDFYSNLIVVAKKV